VIYRRRARVRAAFLALADRDAAVRFRAAVFAWRETAFFDPALWPSRFKAREEARARVPDGLRPFRADSCRARFFAALPFGLGTFTPARRALESPIAIACFVLLAPCFPSRT
jgi:hypothetical protein